MTNNNIVHIWIIILFMFDSQFLLSLTHYFDYNYLANKFVYTLTKELIIEQLILFIYMTNDIIAR